MATDVTDYLTTLPEPARSRIAELYAQARDVVPEAVEGRSYGMPALLYQGKGLFSVMSTAKHIGVYPFGNLGEFAGAVEDAGLGSTKGSIHLREGESLDPALLTRLLLRRRAQIDGR